MEFLFPEIGISLWGLNRQEWNKLYADLRGDILRFWGLIIAHAKGEECALCDCAIAAAQLHLINSVFFDGFKIEGKSDKLIYEVSSTLKKSSSVMSHFSNEEVAYYTSLYFDKWISR